MVTYAKHPIPLEGVLSVPMDVREPNSIKKVLYSLKPDVTVYLGGSEDPAWVEANPKLADRIFAAGPGDVLHATEIAGGRFLYVSTSNVFDGTKGNYEESDNISPTTLLGKLKASGETLVRGRSNSASVLRLSSLVGSSHPWRPSSFDRLRFALESETKTELRDDEYHSWCSVSSAVEAIEDLIEKAPKNALFHFGGLTRLTPLEMGRIFARSLGYSEEAIAKTLVPKKRVMQKGMIILPEGEKFDFSLNSSALVRAIGTKPVSIEYVVRREFEFKD